MSQLNSTGRFSDFSIVKSVSDNHGEKYHVVLDDNNSAPIFKVLTADARIQETEVGYANCLFESDDILMLSDIRIREDVILVYQRTGWFWRFQKVRREKKNFQRRGLGSELLKCVLAFAVEKSMKKIVGKIKGVDYPKNPNLPKWYADMGFTVTMETEPAAVKGWISKEL